MNRIEHLTWARNRAIEFIERGDSLGAYQSLSSDLSKHVETRDAIKMIADLAKFKGGQLDTPAQMRAWIMERTI